MNLTRRMFLKLTGITPLVLMVGPSGLFPEEPPKATDWCDDIFIGAINQNAYKGVRRSRWVVVADSQRRLDQMFLEWTKRFGPFLSTKIGRYDVSDMRLDYLGVAVEASVTFLNMNRPYHVMILKGMEVTGAVVAERCEKDSALAQSLRARVGRYPSIRSGGSVSQGLIFV